MDVFLILSAFAIAAMLFIVRGLASLAPESDRRLNISFFNARLATLRRNVSNGLMTKKDARKSETFLSRSLIKAQETLEDLSESHDENARKHVRIFIIFAWIFLPLSTLGLYAFLGRPAALEHASTRTLVQDAAFLRAQARLQLDPRHHASLTKVFPRYMRQGRFEAAIKALETLLKIEKPTAEKYAQLAQAHSLSHGGFLPPEAKDALKKALHLEPTHATARFLMAVSEQQEGHRDAAIVTLRDLAKESEDEKKKEFFTRYANRLSQETDRSETDRSADQQLKPPQVVLDMVARLEARLFKTGGSFREWEKLLRSYRVLQKDDGIRKTLEEILKRYGSDERPETKAWLSKIRGKFSPQEKKNK